jgi:hypothetical protein
MFVSEASIFNLIPGLRLGSEAGEGVSDVPFGEQRKSFSCNPNALGTEGL